MDSCIIIAVRNCTLKLMYLQQIFKMATGIIYRCIHLIVLLYLSMIFAVLTLIRLGILLVTKGPHKMFAHTNRDKAPECLMDSSLGSHGYLHLEVKLWTHSWTHICLLSLVFLLVHHGLPGLVIFSPCSPTVWGYFFNHPWIFYSVCFLSFLFFFAYEKNYMIHSLSRLMLFLRLLSFFFICYFHKQCSLYCAKFAFHIFGLLLKNYLLLTPSFLNAFSSKVSLPSSLLFITTTFHILTLIFSWLDFCFHP